MKRLAFSMTLAAMVALIGVTAMSLTSHRLLSADSRCVPQDVSASYGNGAVTVSWSAPDDCVPTSYETMRVVSGSRLGILKQGIQGTSVTDTTVKENRTYRYSVRAVNSDGAQPWSNSGSVTTSSGTQPTPTPTPEPTPEPTAEPAPKTEQKPPVPPQWTPPEKQPVPSKEPVIARHHGTSSETITYHGVSSKRASNLTVVRNGHKDVHFTWNNPAPFTEGVGRPGNYRVYRSWSGADTAGVLCIDGSMSISHSTSFTDASVASYHPAGDEATYEYRIYSGSGACVDGGWPGGGNYVKVVLTVDHHEDVYAATNTGPVLHNDPQVPAITSVTVGGRSEDVVRGAYIEARWNAIPYAPGYRVQYKKTAEADTEWKSTYEFRKVEGRSDDPGNEYDNCTGNPGYTDDSQGSTAQEHGVGTRSVTDVKPVCVRANYPTDQVGLRWPVYWGADGHGRIRHAPAKLTLHQLDGNTQYDIRIAMCTQLEDSTRRGLQVCAAVSDYSAKRTVTTAQ